ncbi:MAG: sodium-dependent transporter [Bacteroidales bacterium]|nr:sodium-dependent transporter [Bacteroidales bacterium]MBN2697763.1 sodium-dependent transporter [Bacteroidales bacterium]
MLPGENRIRDSFSSKFGIIAAAAGSAIGLGNIWRFPYVAGQNGGGAFLIIYLVFVAAIGIPVMMSEFTIGRMAQLNPVGAFKKIAPGKRWHLVGLLGVVSAFIILAFYTVVAGWTLEYLVQSVKWLFTSKTIGFSSMSTEALKAFFTDHYDHFLSGIWRPALWFVLMMFFTGYIVISGVKDGIEKYAKVLMPVLFIILIILVIRSVTLDGSKEGLIFLFKPDFSVVREKPVSVILEALGQAFFSLSIGMGTLITYGSYIRKKENLANTAVSVVAADTFTAVIAGLAIFPAVFSFGISPDQGPELVYITLPVIFQKMAGGFIWAFLFFLLLCFAAVTSTISVLEVIVAYFSEQLDMSRRNATILAMITVGFLGLLCTVSKDLFNLFNASPDLLLPLGGFFIVIFIGWFLSKNKSRKELSSNGAYSVGYYRIFIFLVRFVAPLAIAVLFLLGLYSKISNIFS